MKKLLFSLIFLNLSVQANAEEYETGVCGNDPVDTTESFIELISPNGGEEWRQGDESDHHIVFNYSNVDTVRITLLDEGSSEFDVTSLDLNSSMESFFTKELVSDGLYKGTYDWQMEAPLSKEGFVHKKNFKIKILGFHKMCTNPSTGVTYNKKVADESDDFIQLLERPRVKFTNYVLAPWDGKKYAPETPMTLYEGDTYKVSWWQEGIDSIDIYYGRYEWPYNPDGVFHPIVEKLKIPTNEGEWAYEGSFEWKIPENLDPDYTDPERRFYFKAVGYDEAGEVVLSSEFSNLFRIFTNKYFLPTLDDEESEETEEVEKAEQTEESLENTEILDGFDYQFTDVSEADDYESIILLKDLGIVQGYEDGSFKPKNNINRAEFIKIVMEAKYKESLSLGLNCFSDVSAEWYAKYICNAKEAGIISGYQDGEFKPSNNISLAEAYKIFVETFFDFEGEIEENFWYQKYVNFAEENNFSLSIPPLQLITREEMATMLAKIIQIIQE